MPLVCLFDVNETLLDLSALDPQFEREFGAGKPVRTEWFQQLLQAAFLSTLLGPYTDFGALGAAALDMIAQKHDLTLRPEQKAAILQGMRSLPPHPEVAGALERLRRGGFRLTALTNSAPDTARAQITPGTRRAPCAPAPAPRLSPARARSSTRSAPRPRSSGRTWTPWRIDCWLSSVRARARTSGA